jgi:hypothetical protein
MYEFTRVKETFNDVYQLHVLGALLRLYQSSAGSLHSVKSQTCMSFSLAGAASALASLLLLPLLGLNRRGFFPLEGAAASPAAAHDSACTSA